MHYKECHEYNNIIMHAVVNIGFQSLEFPTEESTSARARVCAQIDAGSLEREVTAFLSTIAGGTATGSYALVILHFNQMVHP